MKKIFGNCKAMSRIDKCAELKLYINKHSTANAYAPY